MGTFLQPQKRRRVWVGGKQEPMNSGVVSRSRPGSGLEDISDPASQE